MKCKTCGHEEGCHGEVEWTKRKKGCNCLIDGKICLCKKFIPSEDDTNNLLQGSTPKGAKVTRDESSKVVDSAMKELKNLKEKKGCCLIGGYDRDSCPSCSPSEDEISSLNNEIGITSQSFEQGKEKKGSDTNTLSSKIYYAFEFFPKAEVLETKDVKEFISQLKKDVEVIPFYNALGERVTENILKHIDELSGSKLTKWHDQINKEQGRN